MTAYKFFLLFTTCIISTLSYSQNSIPGYLIKLNGDSIKGFFKAQDASKYSSQTQFSETSNGIYKSYYPESIKGYDLSDGQLFRSVTYTDKLDSNRRKTVFGKLLLEGYYSVFSINQGINFYYLVLDNNKEEWLLYNDIFSASRLEVQGTYKNNLAFLARTCPSLTGDAEKVGFYEQEILAFIQKVNSCVLPSSKTSFHTQNLETKVNVIGFAGGFPKGNGQYQIAFQGFVRLAFPQFIRNLSFNLGVSYSKRKIKSTYDPYGYILNRVTEKELLSFPLQIQYNFTSTKFQPYFFGGASYFNYNEFVQTETFPDDNIKDNRVTIFGGLGFEYFPIKNLMVKLEWRTEQYDQLPVVGLGFRF